MGPQPSWAASPKRKWSPVREFRSSRAAVRAAVLPETNPPSSRPSKSPAHRPTCGRPPLAPLPVQGGAAERRPRQERACFCARGPGYYPLGPHPTRSGASRASLLQRSSLRMTARGGHAQPRDRRVSGRAVSRACSLLLSDPMATMATEDTTSTHPTESTDAPQRRPDEVGGLASEAAPPSVRPAPEPLDSATLDPYDNIACTD
jgi:hypothetical protein